MAHAEIEVDLIVEAAESGHERLRRHVGIERHLGKGLVAELRQRVVAWIGLVATQAFGEQVAGLEVLGLFRGPEREEELRVHPGGARLQAETNEQRRALTKTRIG